MYLMRYGYMDSIGGGGSDGKSASLISHETLMRNSISEFQRFAGLEQTGEMNEETEKMMEMPRCGVKDIVGHGAKARKKRYALQGKANSTLNVYMYVVFTGRPSVTVSIERDSVNWV